MGTGARLPVGDSTTSVQAARGGHLEVLQWLQERIPRDANMCLEAADDSGHVEVARWVRAQPAP